ncbi:MAG: GAF domain-containing protein [Bacteroidia bacterium]|jgi:GAF domain-containing protein|nr:GAF domain-containing protein [Bacteroidia bacterium]
MAESINIPHTSDKKQIYLSLIPQLDALLKGEPDIIANMANTAAVLKEAFNWLWVGFYIVKNNQLVLGPFQGPVACTRIAYGKGVCGTSWKQSKTIIVPNVHEFPGHIACSSLSNSEIVLPLIKNNNVLAVLDIDSEHLNSFDQTDELYLTQVVELITKEWHEG